MSDAPHNADGFDHDDVNVRKILAVGAISIVVFAASSVVAYFLVKTENASLAAAQGAPRHGALIGQEEIGIVDQVPFDGDHRLEGWREGRHERLNSYGWVDRSKGIVHIPISEAMNQVIGQYAAGGAAK